MSKLFPVVAVLVALPAYAGGNDFVLHRFRDCGGVANCTDGIVRERPFTPDDVSPNRVQGVLTDSKAFGSFAKELGLAIGAPALEPAETLGQAGFAYGLSVSVTDIKNEERYWQLAMPDAGAKPPDLLTAMHLGMRKGLPFSIQLGGDLSWLGGSEMFALGANAKWAVNEGFDLLPDLSARVGVSRLLGNKDLDLSTIVGDVTLSHPFEVGGVLVLTPYVGVSQARVNASSHVLDATPGLDGFPAPHCNTEPTDGPDRGTDGQKHTEECLRGVESVETADLRSNFVLAQQDSSVTRFVGGLRTRTAIVNVVAEAVLGGGLATYAGKLELDF